MFGVMIVMLSGILIGYILRNIRAIPTLVSKINIYIIFLLLFVMGLSVGSNPQVIQGLGTLGLLGIAISVVSIAGSVFLSWIVYRHLFKKRRWPTIMKNSLIHSVMFCGGSTLFLLGHNPRMRRLPQPLYPVRHDVLGGNRTRQWFNRTIRSHQKI